MSARSNFESHGGSSSPAHSSAHSPFHNPDLPNRGAEATDIRSAQGQLETSLGSSNFENASKNLQSVVNTCKVEDPNFFAKLATKMNLETPPEKYNFPDSKTLLAGFNQQA
jgi:hypothetical protein